MKQVRISELKSHLSEHLRSVEAGEAIEVMDRARAIARVVPLEGEASGLELMPAERSFESVRRLRMPRAKLAFGSLVALRQERGSR